MFEHHHHTIIVTPVYEDAAAYAMLLDQLSRLFGNALYVVAVDDGSLHHPLSSEDLPDGVPDHCIIKLRRNVGHQRAIATGLNFTAPHLMPHQRLIIMDSDGEDAPEACRTLLQPLDAEKIDIVVAQRRKRSESLQFRVFYAVYKLLFRFTTGRSIGFGNFMAMVPTAARRLAVMPELSIHVAGAALASKLRILRMPVDRSRRYQGQSKMNFQSLVLHGLKAIMVFAEDFLVRAGLACLVVACVSVLCMAIAIGIKTMGVPTPGWFSLTLGILVLISLQAGSLTLMALMLNSVIKGNPIAPGESYAESIEEVSYFLRPMHPAPAHQPMAQP